MNILFNKTMNMLAGMLDYRSARHKIISSNVANIDTEGFKPSDISFKQELGKANAIQIQTTDPAHLGHRSSGAGPLEIITSEGKVQVDTEMANLAENQLMYNITAEMLSRKIRTINTVLKEAK